MNKYAPDYDEEWFREHYLEKGWSTQEIADEVGLSPEGVRGRLETYGIDRRDPKVERLRDEEWLREQYLENKNTATDIAEFLGCGRQTVYDWLDNHGIPTIGKAGYASMRPASYFCSMSSGGYPVWKDSKSREMVLVHRLLAVAEYGFEEIADKSIHHKNGVKWDNRHSNIEPISPSEHTRLHNKELHAAGVFDGSLDRSRDEQGMFESESVDDA